MVIIRNACDWQKTLFYGPGYRRVDYNHIMYSRMDI